jgi:hypothetical protein
VTDLDAYLRQAKLYGPEPVFESAAGLGASQPDLPLGDLVALARGAGVNPRRPGDYEPLVEEAAALFWRVKNNGIMLDSAKIGALEPVVSPGPMRAKVVSEDAPEADQRLAALCARIVCARGRYARLVATILDAASTPSPTTALRPCEWCGRPNVGRSDRRTCTPRCRRALARARGVGPFSRPSVTPTWTPDLDHSPRRSVAPTPSNGGHFRGPKQGSSNFR